MSVDRVYVSGLELDPPVVPRFVGGGSTAQQIDDLDARQVALVVRDDDAVVGGRDRGDDRVEAAGGQLPLFPKGAANVSQPRGPDPESGQLDLGPILDRRLFEELSA